VRKNKIAKTLIVLSFLSATAFSQQNNFSSTERNTFTGSSLWAPQIIVTTSHQFNNSAWGFANYLQLGKIGNGWGQGYIGLQYSPSSSLVATVYAGTETNNWWRLAAEANVKWKNVYFYNWYEYGKTPALWISVLSWSLAKDFKVKAKSYLTSKNIRIGPGFSYSPIKSLAITPIALYNSADKHVGIQLDIVNNF
jgi:hypothetical protein